MPTLALLLRSLGLFAGGCRLQACHFHAEAIFHGFSHSSISNPADEETEHGEHQENHQTMSKNFVGGRASHQSAYQNQA
ncbi:MAG: hypothetical protein D6753_07660 [Planctomycetota bacterium]|nr:MAG: hypothetical protein D6753_07660 [Planctomycetota bacterium]